MVHPRIGFLNIQLLRCRNCSQLSQGQQRDREFQKLRHGVGRFIDIQDSALCAPTLRMRALRQWSCLEQFDISVTQQVC